MLDVVRKSSFNPNTNKYYAYAPAWAPILATIERACGRRSVCPTGRHSTTLLKGGAEIKKAQSIQMGIGMSPKSTPSSRALLWSFGGSIQDANENVVINSPETVAAVEFMTKLFKQ
jgi:multiple sugar transport system substrate-binding protein